MNLGRILRRLEEIHAGDDAVYPAASREMFLFYLLN
jgi:hypothetical protein